MEVASEDPLVNGQHGVAYSTGVQEGEDPRYLKTVVTLKHWDAYSLEDSDKFTRHNFNAIVSNFTLADSYWPAFKSSVIDGQAHGVMCSYNAVNGVPSCANSFMSRTVLRGTWNFTGYITSDSGAVEDIYKVRENDEKDVWDGAFRYSHYSHPSFSSLRSSPIAATTRSTNTSRLSPKLRVQPSPRDRATCALELSTMTLSSQA